MRLGDLDALKEELKQYFSDGVLDSVSAKLAFNMILRKIDEAPSVEGFTKEDMSGAYNEGYACGSRENERPQGEWKKHGLCFECPECHCGCMFTIVDKIVYGELNFCPNCGAKMKGGADND